MSMVAGDKGEKITCLQIIQQWARCIQAKIDVKETVLFMDAYYLTEEERRWLKLVNISYMAALQQNRFSNLMNSMSRCVNKAGTHILFYNHKTNKGACHTWCENHRIGRKSLMGNEYTVQRESDRKSKPIPLFDEYGTGFSGCDQFNAMLHGKRWPYRYRSDMAAAHDYLLTSTAINVFNVWKDVDESRENVVFNDFLRKLALGLVEKVASTR